MAITYHISVQDGMSGPTRAQMTALLPARVNPVLARAVANKTRRHLFDRDASHANRMGGKRTHFYGQAARATQSGIESDGFFVSVSGPVGFRQRLEGGTIKPINVKMLTIPACAEAYGHRAREFNNLRFALLKGIPALVQATSQRIGYLKVKAGSQEQRELARAYGGKAPSHVVKRGAVIPDKVMYWLARSVYQGPDPGVLPTEIDYDLAITVAFSSYMKRLEDRTARAAAKKEAK